MWLLTGSVMKGSAAAGPLLLLLLLLVLFFLICGDAHGWRSECDIGAGVELALHGPAPVDDGEDTAHRCRVAFLSSEDLKSPPQGLETLDIILTDSLAHVSFLGRRGPAHFLDNVTAFHVPGDLDAIMQGKTELLSVLLPPPGAGSDLAESIRQQAEALLPEHVYVDDGSWDLHAAAFSRYRFSLIAQDFDKQTISSALVRSVAFHTVALFNGFVEIGAMFFNGIADFEADPFDLHSTLGTIKKHNEHLGALWHYQRIIQDQLQYRYNRPFEERLYSQACSLCRLMVHREGRLPPIAFVGIYSARSNFEKRQAVRDTWGKVLRAHGLRYRFFLGEASAGSSSEEQRVRLELEEHDDLVFLDASEGYRMNSRKGLLFLEWIALRAEAEFLLKIDDDVYFRPEPLLAQLRSRSPAQYAWGYFDYISPVPREDGDHFQQSDEGFPFPVFPPYPRGVVRVLSMDIVRLLAKASREGRLRMIFGDDPNLGVHLRQLLFDPVDPLPSLTLDDFDNRVFAMEPSCHPNLWSRITRRTWAIHHVSPEQILCMWRVDLEAGYYREAEHGIEHDDSMPLDSLPDVCSCAAEPSFEARTDLDDIRQETDRILYDRVQP